MKRFSFMAVFLLCTVGGAVSIPPARSDSPVESTPHSGLAVVLQPHVRITGVNHADFDFGTVKLTPDGVVQHTFVLRNEGTKPLQIAQLLPNCHCTTGRIDTIGGKALPASNGAFPTVLPGQDVDFTVTVRLAGHPLGPLSKGVFLFDATHSEPIAFIEAVGVLQ